MSFLPLVKHETQPSAKRESPRPQLSRWSFHLRSTERMCVLNFELAFNIFLPFQSCPILLETQNLLQSFSISNPLTCPDRSVARSSVRFSCSSIAFSWEFRSTLGTSIIMQRVVKVAASSGLWLRRAGDVQRSSAVAMSTAVKVDGGKNSSGIDKDAPGVNPAEREAFRFCACRTRSKPFLGLFKNFC